MDSKAQVVLGVIQAVQDRDAETLERLHHDDLEFSEAPSLPYGASSRARTYCWSSSNQSPRKPGSEPGGHSSPLRPTGGSTRGWSRSTATRWWSSTGHEA
jgi:hypothetical protein